MPVVALSRGLRLCIACWLVVAGAAGQCQLTVPNRELGDPSGNSQFFASMLWDPDGAGPETQKLLLQSDWLGATIFLWDPATGVLSNRVFSGMQRLGFPILRANGDLVSWGVDASGITGLGVWQGNTWSRLGAPFVYPFCVTEATNGNLVAGGNFTDIGGVPINRVAQWDGVAWSALGSGMDFFVRCLATMPNGDVVAGGDFTTAGGVAANKIARWNGSAWLPFGTGMDGRVSRVWPLPNGDLIAAGSFQTAGGVAVGGIARWDGVGWSAMGAGIYPPNAMILMPNGDLIFGTSLGNVMRWDGTAWSQIGTPLPGSVSCLNLLPSGDLIASGDFNFSGSPYPENVARWDGANWTPRGIGTDFDVNAYTDLPDGSYVAGGAFTKAGDVAAQHVARWTDAGWSTLGSGVDGAINALVTFASGNVIAGGSFTTAGGAAASRIAQWDGMNWSPLGNGVDGSITCLARMPNGDVVAGGYFTTAGGVPANHIARWDGSNWHAMGSGLSDGAHALAVLSNGDLIAGGVFWSAGGVATNKIARWNGTTWSAIGGGMNSDVYSLLPLANGEFVAGGLFTQAGGVPANFIARWTGSGWSAMGSGLNVWIRALALLPNGDIMAGGDYGNYQSLYRWDGSSWGPSVHPNGRVLALHSMPDGDLLIGGEFTHVYSPLLQPAGYHHLRLSTSCPATAVPIATGCVGPSGPITLAAEVLPWVGATFRSRVDGLVPGSFVFALAGLQSPGLPLSIYHPAALAGCDLWASPDSVQWLDAQGNTAYWWFPIPVIPSLVGLPIYHQVLDLQVDALSVPLTISSSNGLVLTLGQF
jgi:hypothetical protein